MLSSAIEDCRDPVDRANRGKNHRGSGPQRGIWEQVVNPLDYSPGNNCNTAQRRNLREYVEEKEPCSARAWWSWEIELPSGRGSRVPQILTCRAIMRPRWDFDGALVGLQRDFCLDFGV